MSQRSMATSANADAAGAKLQVSAFDRPFCLLGVAWLQIPATDDGFSLEHKKLSLPVKVQVPEGTEFIHVSLLSSQQAFGPFGACQPRALGAIRHDINIVYEDGKLKKDDNNWCEFTFMAVLEDQTTIAASGLWSGFYFLEVMCLGPTT
jgi:hypothetical protein